MTEITKSDVRTVVVSVRRDDSDGQPQHFAAGILRYRGLVVLPGDSVGLPDGEEGELTGYTALVGRVPCSSGPVARVPLTCFRRVAGDSGASGLVVLEADLDRLPSAAGGAKAGDLDADRWCRRGSWNETLSDLAVAPVPDEEWLAAAEIVLRAAEAAGVAPSAGAVPTGWYQPADHDSVVVTAEAPKSPTVRLGLPSHNRVVCAYLQWQHRHCRTCPGGQRCVAN